ncbi:hypothetical protein [Niallia sp. FSL R7-0271]|uniref:hypothetical protein n=1 Tax=Niallia sp. FSL R7-0271 TaxID=2921678 RepID=UPI0030FB4B4A
MNKEPQELIVFCNPYNGESFDSFLSRLSEKNLYDGTSYLYGYAGLNKNKNIGNVNKRLMT